MPPIGTRIRDGFSHASAHLALAAVPLVTALIATDRIRQILGFRGAHAGVQFTLPAAVVDVWAFVSVPAVGVNAWLSMPVGTSLAPLLVPVAVVLKAGLRAGYFGSLRDAVETGGYDFVGNVRRHFRPFLLYASIPVLALLPVLAFTSGTGRGAILLVLLPFALVLYYLFFATPDLVVLQETDLVSAARASADFAVEGGPYLRYAAGFGGFALLVSLPFTLVVANFGAVGIGVGIVVGSPLGLACNVATMRFVADVDPESPTLGDEWDDSNEWAPDG